MKTTHQRHGGTMATLPHVDPDHKWSKTDILAVQSALRQTCGSIDFEPLPERWQRSIIDEIEAAMEHAWCDCESAAQCTDVAVAMNPVESPDPWGDQSFYYLRKYFIAGEETCAGSTTVAQRCNIAIHDAISGTARLMLQHRPDQQNAPRRQPGGNTDRRHHSHRFRQSRGRLVVSAMTISATRSAAVSWRGMILDSSLRTIIDRPTRCVIRLSISGGPGHQDNNQMASCIITVQSARSKYPRPS